MRILRRLIWIALFVAVLVLGWRFASLNAETVTVDYLLGELPDVPVWALILAAFVAGAVVAGLLSLYELARQGLVARRYRKTAEELESEIHQMRNLPLVGPAGAGEGSATTEGAGSSERG
jgi:uncharacterized integral membrane protein